MKSKTKWIGIGLFGVLVLALAVGQLFFSSDKKEQLLVVLPTAENPFWIEMQEGAKDAAHELGNNVRVTIRTGSEDADARTQIQILKDYSQSGGVSALVLGPASSTEVVESVAQFSKAKIPVVVVDSRLNPQELEARGGVVDAFLGSNNLQGGELAAKEIERRLGDGPHTVLLIEGSAGHETAIARSSGFFKAASPKWKIIRKDGQWERARGREILDGAINTGLPDAVFACNDEMALGAVTALEQSKINRSKWPVIVGFDATADGVAAVKDGKLAATIKQSPRSIGREAVIIAHQLANGDRSHAGDQLLPVELVKKP